MTKKQEFQNMLLLLANNYPQASVSKENIKAITFFVESSIGFDFDWPKAFKEIALREKFFPSASVIVEHVAGRPKSLSEAAKAFVDEAILAFTSGGNAFEALGRDKYYLAKEVGLDKFSIQNGSVDPKFMRGQWADRAERILEKDPAKRSLLTGDRSGAPELSQPSQPPDVINQLAQAKTMEGKL